MSWRRNAARILVALVVGLVLLCVFGPKEAVTLDTPTITLPDDLDGWLAEREAGIAASKAAWIDWRGQPGQRTDLALIYIHGFSGNPSELNPVPHEVAEAVGANLYSVRLAGHGGADETLARSHVADWWHDVAEAVSVGERLGNKVVVMGLSTGGTLAALAALDGELGARIDGVVLLSPNFGVNDRYIRVLDLPFARQIVRLVLPQNRCGGSGDVNSDAGLMAPCPAIEAAIPMAALVRKARAADFSNADQPAFFIWSYEDSIVRPEATSKVAKEWGGRVTRLNVTPGKRDDPYGHMLAGDSFSPRLSPLMAKAITLWLTQLGAT